MAVMNFETRSAANTTPRSSNTNSDRQQSQIWLNVGREVNGKFVSLPWGLGLDTMSEADVRGQNEDFVAMRKAQNQLKEALTKLGFTMEPGAECTLKLEVRMRRVSKPLEITKNDYEIDVNDLLVEAPAADPIESDLVAG